MAERLTAEDWTKLRGFAGLPSGSLIAILPHELRALLDAADEADKLRAQVDRVRALADGWSARGEHQMAYSKTPAVPEEIADALLDSGSEFVERARLIRCALGAPDV